MSFINTKILQLKNKKRTIKDNRKSINTTYNDPTATQRQLVDIDNEINKEKLNQLDQQKKERDKKLEIEKQNIMNECKEVIIETYKICKRIGIIDNSNQMSMMLGKQNGSWFRLYRGDYINQVRYSSLNELKDNLYSLKMGINLLLETDNSLPPKEWIVEKINTLMARLSELQYKIMKLEFNQC